MSKDSLTPNDEKTQQMINWIDNASYEDLLRKWRFAKFPNDFFQGEIGDYYSKIMREKKAQVGNDEHVRASKAIGWE